MILIIFFFKKNNIMIPWKENNVSTKLDKKMDRVNKLGRM